MCVWCVCVCVCVCFEMESPLARLEGSGAVSAHGNLCHLGLSDGPAAASRVAGITGALHRIQLIFCIFSRDGVSPRWPEWSLSRPRDPPALASQSVGITGVSHQAQPASCYFVCVCVCVCWDGCVCGVCVVVWLCVCWDGCVWVVLGNLQKF